MFTLAKGAVAQGRVMTQRRYSDGVMRSLVLYGIVFFVVAFTHTLQHQLLIALLPPKRFKTSPVSTIFAIPLIK